jgi:hypothetical protein
MLEMKQLDNSIFLLESSKHNAIKVEFCNPAGSFSILENNATAEILIEKHGSVLQFFENLYKKGIKKLRITDRKSNGSAFKSCGEYIVNFTAKDGEITSDPIVETQPIPEVQSYQAPVMNFGLGMPQGLGMVEIHRIQDYDRVLAEKQKLEIEVVALKTSNQALKDENLRNEILGTKSVEKSDSHGALIDKYTPVVLALIEKFQPAAKAVAAVGLSGAENFTPLQNAFLQIIQTADASILSDLMAAAQGVSNTDFDAEFTELLKKHNLILA